MLPSRTAELGEASGSLITWELFSSENHSLPGAQEWNEASSSTDTAQEGIPCSPVELRVPERKKPALDRKALGFDCCWVSLMQGPGSRGQCFCPEVGSKKRFFRKYVLLKNSDAWNTSFKNQCEHIVSDGSNFLVGKKKCLECFSVCHSREMGKQGNLI